jgi:hypothetical protein
MNRTAAREGRDIHLMISSTQLPCTDGWQAPLQAQAAEHAAQVVNHGIISLK